MTTRLRGDLASELTPRELEIIQLIATGMISRDIAEHLGIGHGTVRQHITNACNKTGCNNRVRLLLWAIRKGHVTIQLDPKP